MAKINTRGIYNVALDGVGIILKNTPENPSYSQRSAAVFQNRFAQGDRSEADFSFWWYWSEADWDKGFQETFYTPNDLGYFKSGNNIDLVREPGKILALAQPQTVATHSWGTSVVLGDAINFGQQLLYGFSRSSGSAMLASQTTDGTVTTYAYAAGHGSTIVQMEAWGGYAWIASQTSAGGSAIVGMNTGGTFSIPTYLSGTLTPGQARGVCAIGQTLYIAYLQDSSTTGDVIWSTTDGSIWTQNVSRTGYPRKVIEGSMISYRSTLYYLTGEGQKTELWNYTSGVSVKVYTWPSLLNPKISTYLSWLVISATVGGKTIYFTYDGNTISSQFEQLPFTSNVGASKIYENFGYGYSDGLMQWTNDSGELVFAPGFNYLTNGTRGVPIASFNGFTYFNSGLNAAGSLVISKVSQTTGTNYLTTGTYSISSPLHTGFIPDVDKIYHDAILRFDPLTSGEKITVDYSTDPLSDDTAATWTTLGSADHAVDGAITSKRIQFPITSPVISKQMKHRVTLTTSGTTTPRVQDIVFRYLPMPYYPHEWSITANASDEVELLNHTLDTKTGRKLRNQIQISYWKNQLVDWQDIDYASTQLTGTLSSSATVANVLDTKDFSEVGRFVIDGETTFYTGKTPSSFTGLTRGARGSTAVAHGSASTVDNAYRVLITDVNSNIPILNQGLKVEYATNITIREDI